MKSCYHTPPCGTASVHHARRNRDAHVARDASAHALETTLRRSGPQSATSIGGVPSCKADPSLLRAATGRAPWELSAAEFEAAREPWFELSRYEFGACRMFGLSISEMRFGLRLRLAILGGPEDGFVVDVDGSDEASLHDPRRAFVVDALARGLRVPQHVLADYPDLSPID
jgi:hypothetical protein